MDDKELVAQLRVQEIDNIAVKFGYARINYNNETRLISYMKYISGGKVRIDVYFTTMTVSVSLNHPNKGKTQLHRKNVSDTQLARIFSNPRIHTGKGYYKKRKKKDNQHK